METQEHIELGQLVMIVACEIYFECQPFYSDNLAYYIKRLNKEVL